MIAIILVALGTAPFAVWAVVRLFGLERGWPLVPLVAFTPYAAVLSVLPLAAALVLRAWVVAAVAATSALALALAVVPRAWRRPEPATGGPVLRLLTSNLLFGAAAPEDVLSLVRTQSVDLLALQECTPESDKALRAGGLEMLLPFRMAHPRDEPGGSALYSRHPLVDGGYRYLPPDFGQSYAILRVPGAAEVHVESVHPCAPSHRRMLRYWWAGLAAQPRPVPGGPPRILLGDFNATLDHVPLRRLLRCGYRDAAAVVGGGLAGTWPYLGPRLPRITLDHVLVQPGVAVHAVSTRRIRGTDHRAVLAVLSLPREVPPSGEDVHRPGDDQRHRHQ